MIGWLAEEGRERGGEEEEEERKKKIVNQEKGL